MAAACNLPKGFYCAHSQKLMESPAMHVVCGHIFERSVLIQSPTCPLCQNSKPLLLEDIIPFSELGERIRLHQQQSATSDKEQIERQVARLALGSAADPSKALALEPTIRWKRKDVHFDDVHALREFGEGFVTGSKDGCVSLWNRKGELLRKLYERDAINYKEWVTALGSNSDCVISGTRNGWLDAWDVRGQRLNYRQSWRFKPKVEGGYIAKARNLNRATCITVLPNCQKGTPFFVGGPAYLHFLSVTSSGWFTCHSSSQVHANDWAYCIRPINADDPLGHLLVVIGAQIDLLIRDKKLNPYKQSAWTSSEPLVVENKDEVGKRGDQLLRPHIASIKPVPAHLNQLAYACFENNKGFGPIRVVDLTTKQRLFDGQAHQGRSWDVDFVQQYLLASGGDDGVVKLWDIRCGGLKAQPQQTLPKHCGRVSCLISPKENMLLTASCPDNVHESREKAQFTFWDLRMPKRLFVN